MHHAGVAGNVDAFKALLAAGADVAHCRGYRYYSAHAAMSPVLFPGWVNFTLDPSMAHAHFSTLCNFGGGLHVFERRLPSPTSEQVGVQPRSPPHSPRRSSRAS